MTFDTHNLFLAMPLNTAAYLLKIYLVKSTESKDIVSNFNKMC